MLKKGVIVLLLISVIFIAEYFRQTYSNIFVRVVHAFIFVGCMWLISKDIREIIKYIKRPRK